MKPRDFAASYINDYASEMVHAVARTDRHTPQESLNASNKFSSLKGLGHVVVTTQTQANHFVRRLMASAKKEDGNR